MMKKIIKNTNYNHFIIYKKQFKQSEKISNIIFFHNQLTFLSFNNF